MVAVLQTEGQRLALARDAADDRVQAKYFAEAGAFDQIGRRPIELLIGRIEYNESTRVADIDAVEDRRGQKANCIEGYPAAGLHDVQIPNRCCSDSDGGVRMNGGAIGSAGECHGTSPRLGGKGIPTHGKDLGHAGAGVQLQLDLDAIRAAIFFGKLGFDQQTVRGRLAVILAHCLDSAPLPGRRSRVKAQLALSVVDEEIKLGEKIFAEYTLNARRLELDLVHPVNDSAQLGDGGITHPNFAQTRQRILMPIRDRGECGLSYDRELQPAGQAGVDHRVRGTGIEQETEGTGAIDRRLNHDQVFIAKLKLDQAL